MELNDDRRGLPPNRFAEQAREAGPVSVWAVLYDAEERTLIAERNQREQAEAAAALAEAAAGLKDIVEI